MTDRTMTVTFDHLSDAEATRAVLESSIPGIDVDLQQPDAVPAPGSETGRPDEIIDEGSWQLTATVPVGMDETAADLVEQTAPRQSK